MLNMTAGEKALTKDMPDQVAIGFIKARRAAEGPPKDAATTPNPFGGLFGGPFG